MNKIVLPLLIVVLFIICSIAEGTDWTFLGKSNMGTVYYDKFGIKQLSGNVIKVLVKTAYSSEGVKEFWDAFPQVDRAESVSYTLYTYEVKCLEDSFRSIKAITYNSSDSAIKGTDLDYIKTGQAVWEHITPGSMMALLSEKSCKYLLYDR